MRLCIRLVLLVLLSFYLETNFNSHVHMLQRTELVIGRPAERLHDLVYSRDEFTVSEISESLEITISRFIHC